MSAQPQPGSNEPKPGPDLLARWAMGLSEPTDPTGITPWAKREWQTADVRRVRAAGAKQAADQERLHSPNQRGLVDWGAVNCALWTVALIVITAVAFLRWFSA